MTTLDAVVAATQARRAAERALTASVSEQHAAMRAAVADRWRIYQVAGAAGMTRPSVHRILHGQDEQATRDEAVA